MQQKYPGIKHQESCLSGVKATYPKYTDVRSLLMSLLPPTDPPTPEQISKTKETLVELFKILTRILKLFKYYNNTYHIYKRYDPKHGSEDTTEYLRHLILGIGLLKHDIKSSTHLGNSTGIDSILKPLCDIISAYAYPEEVDSIIDRYIQPYHGCIIKSKLYEFRPYNNSGLKAHYYTEPAKRSLDSGDEHVYRYSDNFECPYLFPPREYLTENEMLLSKQQINLNPSKSADLRTLTNLITLQVVTTCSHSYELIKSLATQFELDSSVLDKISAFEFDASRNAVFLDK